MLSGQSYIELDVELENLSDSDKTIDVLWIGAIINNNRVSVGVGNFGQATEHPHIYRIRTIGSGNVLVNNDLDFTENGTGRL